MTTITAVPTVAISPVRGISLPILDNVLDDLMGKVTDSIQQAINDATSSVLSLEVEAGRQIQIAIQNAKEAYAESLSLTIDKVNQTITAKIDELANMVQIVQENNKELLGKAAADAQQLINDLPLTKKQPQLTSIAPQYMAVNSQADTVLVKFSGNFPWSGDPKYPTSLMMNNQPCPVFQNTTQELVYSVPVAAIPNTAVDKCTYLMGNLKVLWDNGWIFSNTKEANYKIGMAVLPLTPGQISAHYTSGGTQRMQKAYTSPTYNYDGNSWYPRRWVTLSLSVPPEAGWHIDRNVQPRLVMHPGAHGNHTQSIASYDENGVQVTIGLECSSGHYMGVIQFHLEFTEYQDQPISQSRTEDIDLRWGDSKMLDPQVGETVWKVAFRCFDGSYNEFGPADIGNKYLKLINEGETIRLIAQVPNQIQP